MARFMREMDVLQREEPAATPEPPESVVLGYPKENFVLSVSLW
jgi:hypothetical protein